MRWTQPCAATSRQPLTDAETEAAEAIAGAISGDGDRATVDAGRERVEKLRSDLEYSDVELQAAEQVMPAAQPTTQHAPTAV